MTGPASERAQAVAGRARRSLLWSLVAFGCAQLGLLVWMEFFKPELYHPEYGQRLPLLKKRLAEEPNRPLILMLGSSRIEMGFRPEVLPEYQPGHADAPLLFNFGIAASGGVEQLVHLQRLLREGIRPRHVFVEIFPGIMGVGEKGGIDHYDKLTRTSFRDLPVLRRLSVHPRQLYRDWLLTRLTPWVSYRLPIQNCYAPRLLNATFRRDQLWEKPDRSGWLTNHWTLPPEARAPAVAFAKAEFTHALQHLEVAEHVDHAYRELLDLCRREKIGVTLLITPEGEVFRRLYQADREEVLRRYLKNLSNEFGVAVVDARSWIDDELYYVDSHHLLPAGAELFTKRLEREAIRPLHLNLRRHD